MFQPLRDRPLHWLAGLNVLLHLAGLALAAIGIRPGTAAASLTERMTYLGGNPPGWWLGWSVWVLCALALVTFVAVTVRMLEMPSPLAMLSLILAVTGAAFDLFCDSAYIRVLPFLAAPRSESTVIAFQATERGLAIGSLAVANGFYSLATLLLTITLSRQARPSTLLRAIGYGVALFGFLLAAAAFTGHPWHTEVAAGMTIGFYCVWTVLVARTLEAAVRRL